MRIRMMCAVCGDTDERNVRFVYYNESDNICYNVCTRCKERHRVNDSTTDNWGHNVQAMYSGEIPEYVKPSRLALCAPATSC